MAHMLNPPRKRPIRRKVDEGLNNMFAVMKELVKGKYTREIYPEHQRRLDYDVEARGIASGYPGGGATRPSLTTWATRAPSSSRPCPDASRPSAKRGSPPTRPFPGG